MKALGVIPARLASTRFPNKPLAELFGKTMIEHTLAATMRSTLLDRVLVATDSERICEVVGTHAALLTPADCATGTDRVVAALTALGPAELRTYDVVVNVQGDEPGVDPRHIDQCIAALRADPASVMSTLATPIRSERDALSRDVVKCVADQNGNALYFSRALIPHSKSGAYTPETTTYLRHVGLYAFRPEFLLQFPSLPRSALEESEDLEQLRVLSAGHTIKLVQVDTTLPGVDTREELEALKAQWPLPAKPSGSSLLKNKDVKKLRKDAAVRFSCDDALVLAFAPTKSDVRKVSFQAPSRVVVYVTEDAHEPVIFDATGKGELCPTVYALWRSSGPALLPSLVVHAPVSEFVLRGADVMLPGVVFASPEELASLRKGELRAVVARGNPMPFAVGELLVDGVDVERSGKKGRALRLLHVVGDELWKMGPKTVPNEGFLGSRVVPLDETDDETTMTATTTDRDNDSDALGLELADVTLEDKAVAVDAENDVPVPLTTHEMDEAFVATLLQVLKTSRVKEKELPMLASTFQASVFLPNRPEGLSLAIKQSSFKKTSAFLQAMQTRGLLTVVEKDGVQTITAISRRHPDVVAHTLYRTEEEAQAAQAAAASATAGQPAFLPGQYAPEIDEFLGLPASIKAMFLNEREHAATHFAAVAETKHWRAVDVRALVTTYIELHQLVDARDKKFVRLDGPLTDALYGKKPPAGGYPQRLARPDVVALLLAKCQKFHRVTLYPGHDARIVGGDLRPIAVHAERAKAHASSVTTSVAFYQQFGIDGARFAKEAQKKWGSSATTHVSADKSKGEEIRVQGQMVNEVLDLLATGYRINTTTCCVVSYGKNVKPKKRN